MTDIGIALLLLVPIVIVIIILNNASRQRKKKAQKKINAYIAEATRQTGITNYFRKQLVHQTVIMDEKNKKLLLVEHKGDGSSFEVFPLDAVKNVLVLNETRLLAPEGKGQKQENLTTKIGLEITFKKGSDDKFLTLYDYLEHNIYMMRDFEKEAHELREKIEKARNGI
ncbi:MAG TPA: hypothetical protein VM187_11560 [Niastella sp.]|nr:hypothetical protein [Niastella sp.]